MRTRTRIIALTLLAAASVAAGPASEKTPEGDLGRLQGRWETKAGPKKDIPVVLEFRGCRVTVELKTPQGLKVRAEGDVKIDESARPRTLDWLHFSAVDGMELPDLLGIYELDGKTFKVCNGGPNNGRPTEFKSGDGALADVVVFQRRKD